MILIEASWSDLSYTTDFSITAGTTYTFKVTANNVYGPSIDSDLLPVLAARVPLAPINLANNAAVTTAYQVGLTWNEGSYNGGASVLDYQVWFKEQSESDYQIFTTGVTQTAATVTGLVPGQTYDFKVQARNIIGLSELSLPV